MSNLGIGRRVRLWVHCNASTQSSYRVSQPLRQKFLIDSTITKSYDISCHKTKFDTNVLSLFVISCLAFLIVHLGMLLALVSGMSVKNLLIRTKSWVPLAAAMSSASVANAGLHYPWEIPGNRNFREKENVTGCGRIFLTFLSTSCKTRVGAPRWDFFLPFISVQQSKILCSF